LEGLTVASRKPFIRIWYHRFEHVTIDSEQTYPTDREALERDCDMSFFVAGGPGGQHRNKVATGVRLVHRPSGSVVTATERRSQAANREAAFARMAERLRAASHRQAPRIATRPGAAAVARRRKLKQRRSEIKQSRRLEHDDD
jgi:protein subunit release factor B